MGDQSSKINHTGRDLAGRYRSFARRRSLRQPNILGRTSSPSSHGQGEAGQSLLEFALIVPVLFLMLIGVTFIAQGFNLQMVLYGAAYEGARVWARNPPIGSSNYCSPPACDPNQGSAINFERYVIPVVRQYMTNNGFDGNQVYFYSKDNRAYRNTLDLVSNNSQLVTVTLLYTIQLPVGNFASSFTNIDVSATCTLKRGS